MAISPINGLVFSSAVVSGMNAACLDNLAQASTKWIRRRKWSSCMTERWLTETRSFPPQTQSLKCLPQQSFPQHRGAGNSAFSCLKAAIKADISCPEIQRRMDNRDEVRARGIPQGEFRTQELLEDPQRNIDIVTAAKSAQCYRFIQTYLPRCFYRGIIETKIQYKIKLERVYFNWNSIFQYWM